MLYTMHHGKIHRATVTQANLEYMGSITIDSELLELSGILPGERVQIVDNNNGNRLETYVIAGERGSGVLSTYIFKCRHFMFIYYYFLRILSIFVFISSLFLSIIYNSPHYFL